MLLQFFYIENVVSYFYYVLKVKKNSRIMHFKCPVHFVKLTVCPILVDTLKPIGFFYLKSSKLLDKKTFQTFTIKSLCYVFLSSHFELLK